MVLIYMMIFCSALYLAKAFYNIVRAVILRAALYIRLSKICKKHGYEMSRKRPFSASFFGFSHPNASSRAYGVLSAQKSRRADCFYGE